MISAQFNSDTTRLKPLCYQPLDNINSLVFKCGFPPSKFCLSILKCKFISIIWQIYRFMFQYHNSNKKNPKFMLQLHLLISAAPCAFLLSITVIEHTRGWLDRLRFLHFSLRGHYHHRIHNYSLYDPLH